MKKQRAKMPVSQRAKQFAPFQAVDGLGAALKRAEEEHRQMVEQSHSREAQEEWPESGEQEI